jgi:ABC-type polysaccharide/polyol phosphate transport system ATPase subunit
MEYIFEALSLIIFLGSGKRALLEVISRRAQGPTRGQILLNGVPVSMRLFQVVLYLKKQSYENIIINICKIITVLKKIFE